MNLRTFICDARWGCFVVDLIGCKGGLSLLWKYEFDIRIQHHLQNHIDSCIEFMDGSYLMYIRFYGFLELNRRKESWDIPQIVGSMIRKDWIIGGDFNKILDDVEKCGVDASR